jgi:hypothetical protein
MKPYWQCQISPIKLYEFYAFSNRKLMEYFEKRSYIIKFKIV